MTEHDKAGEQPPLSAQTRDWLLRLARDTIAHAVGLRSDKPAPAQVPDDAQRPSGCFVTIHLRTGALRGCIGTFEASQPLWQAVERMAVAAALRDPRFPPLEADELGDCRLEISALSPPVQASAAQVEVGKHGVCVARGPYRGVLLPQVATEHEWDRETFLAHTCLKAGLPADAWRDDQIEIETFTAEVFSE